MPATLRPPPRFRPLATRRLLRRLGATPGLGDTTPPGAINVTVQTVSKISQVAGKDSTDITFTANENFVEYQIRRVSSGADNVAMGTLVEGTTVTARGEHTVTITDDELIAASGSEGSNLLKVFVKDAAGNWST
jgi:hypothetical protein